jgi:hypothetical protein
MRLKTNMYNQNLFRNDVEMDRRMGLCELKVERSPICMSEGKRTGSRRDMQSWV